VSTIAGEDQNSDQHSYIAAGGDVAVHGTAVVHWIDGTVGDAADASFHYFEDTWHTVAAETPVETSGTTEGTAASDGDNTSASDHSDIASTVDHDSAHLIADDPAHDTGSTDPVIDHFIEPDGDSHPIEIVSHTGEVINLDDTTHAVDLGHSTSDVASVDLAPATAPVTAPEPEPAPELSGTVPHLHPDDEAAAAAATMAA
jgi:hypothetical protein